MQIVHLDSRRANRASVLRYEIAKEQAEGLGLAGKKLQESIDRYNDALQDGRERARHDELLGDVAARAWALIVQRELIGFVHENQKWVVEHFAIPGAALRLMGRARRAR
jgi:hypothetical protein